MPVRLPLVNTLPSHDYTVALDGVQYGVRLVYRDRTASWYLDLRDEDGNAVLLARRLSPGYAINFVTVAGPPGVLYVTAPGDPYNRDTVEIIYFSGAEVAAQRVQTVAARDTIVEVST